MTASSADPTLKCVILQPSYIPWRGYFHQIQKADVFVFYDDVQYDKRGWRNRNRVKTPQGLRWLTIPVRSRARVENALIKDIRICWERPWAQTHWSTLRHSYSRAPYFQKYEPLLEAFFGRRDELLADFTIAFTLALAGELGIRHTRFLRSSSLKVEGVKSDRLLSVLGAVGSRHYISGPSARAYINEPKVSAAGVSVEYMTYEYPEYSQLHPPYDPFVSILDLLFMEGPEAGRLIWTAAENRGPV